jgi:phosphatidylserine/phosphatidylglycerophosphate/cardiolipin synthase-like enzyme
LAEQLTKSQIPTHRALEDHDQTLQLGDGIELLVDAGQRGQSLILDRAFQIVDAAQTELTITCQYYPGGETARRLAAAGRRGVRVRVFHSPPSIHGRLAPLHRLYNWRESRTDSPGITRYQLPDGSPKIHAKVIYSESAALVGSHNYVNAGVRFGTGETALYVPDEVFVKHLDATINTLIRPYA